MAEKDDIQNIIEGNDFKRTDDNPSQRIKVIGVGGGGNNAVMYMHKKGIKDVSFVLLNTDKQVLKSSDVPTKVLIGPGLGAGGKPERARQYAEDNAERIAELFDDQTDMVFITAGMGGGTGTGAGPVVARIAKERGILTVGIVTIPFLFEGKKKIIKALQGAEEMARNVDSLLVINNQRLTEIYQGVNIFNGFQKADDTLLVAAQSITDIITYRGVINRDFNDVDTTLREGGSAIISTGYGEGPERVTAAIEDALHSPLLKDTDVFGSKKLLMVLYVDEEYEKYDFTMDELEALDEFVHGISEDVDVMWGLYTQPGLKDKVRITILASGFDLTPGETSKNAGKKAEAADERDQERIQEMYGGKSGDVGQGHVIDPGQYDCEDDDNALADFENTPAINRSRFKKYGVGVGMNRFRGRNPEEDKPESATVRDDRNDTAPRPEKKGKTLTFDDID